MRWIPTLLIVAILSPCSSGLEPPEPEPEFEVPADPTRAVLSVVVSSSDLHRRSAILFADGRLQLDSTKDEAQELHLSPDSVRSVLHRAAALRLMEWDGPSIRARMVQQDGKPKLGAVDADRVTVILSVDGYTRGPVSLTKIDRTISHSGIYTSRERYPNIPEFRGLVMLVEWMDEQFGNASRYEN